MTSAARVWVACGVLCGVYAALSWSATAGKSATFDEPSHVAIGWLMLHQGDFRPSPDVPPLWEYWISLPLGRDALHPDTTRLQDMRTAHQGTLWAIQTMYGDPAADALGDVRAARAMALILSTLLGLLIAWWGWRLAGGVPAVAATVLWAMNPTFLGHGALAKNDVAFALAWTAMAYAVWELGRKFSIGRSALVCAVIALAIGTKQTGLLCAPVLGILLIWRACMKEPWGRRAGVAIGVFLAAGVVAYGVLWAAYRFRFDAGPEGPHGKAAYLIDATRYWQIYRDDNWQTPTADQLSRWRPDVLTRCAQWSLDRHFMPEAWIEGFLLTRVGMIGRESFLLGQVYRGGWWYYFPLATIFKSPLALLAGMVLSIGWLARKPRGFEGRWAAAALAVPTAVFGLAAMSSDMNLGIRYILPVFPLLFVAMGVAAARAWRGSGQWIWRPVIIFLGCLLAIETLAAYPDYIAYFNVACGGEQGGRRLLSDSNLDWGQDLPLLAQWQARHPTVPLYLQYAGTCDPAVYGIQYIPLPGGWPGEPAVKTLDGQGMAAISVTALQTPEAGTPAAELQHATPDEVLGGTIALFHYPPER